MSVVVPDESVIVQTRGDVSEAEAEYARTRTAAALKHAHEPVLFVRARLTRLPDAALPQPAIAQANVDLNGRLVRARAVRPTMREAVDELHDRLRDRVQRADRGWESVRGAQRSQPRE